MDSPASPATPVLLVHGLWLRAWTLSRLGAALRKAGFECRRFDYASVSRCGKPAVEALLGALADAPGPVHVVGHSLGGLLVLSALERAPGLRVGRVVCLGSPLAGSAAAAGMAEKPGLRRLLGPYAALLSGGLTGVPDGREVGVVAGRLGVGLGRIFGSFDGPHDGTVAVAETRVPGLSDHCTVAASHSGLLISAEAARQAAAFLRHGRFVPLPR